MNAIRVAALTGLALAGCGLVSSDVADVSFALPEKTATLDAADWQLADQATMPAVDCSAMDMCADAVAALCGAAACSGICGGQTCEAHIAIAVASAIDLAHDVP